MQVVELGDGQACIRPTAILRLAPPVLLALGIVIAAATWREWTTEDSWHPVGLFAAPVAIGAGLQLAFRFGMPSPTFIDIKCGCVFPASGRSRSPLFSSAIQIQDIAALQVVISGPEQAQFFELNLVLREPAGKRVGLLAHMIRPTFEADVATLATLLEVPVLGGEWRPEARAKPPSSG